MMVWFRHFVLKKEAGFVGIFLLPRIFYYVLICLSLTRSCIFFQGCLSKLMGYSSFRFTAST